MPSPDPVFLAMLKTPEARRLFVDDDLPPEDFPIVDPPDLGELWALAKEKAFAAGYLGIRLAAYADTGIRIDLLTPYGWDYFELGQIEFDESGVLSYLVGKPWDSEKGVWR